MRKIAVTTGDRAEFYVQQGVWREIHTHPDLELHVVITGTHLTAPRMDVLNDILDWLSELQRETGKQVGSVTLLPMYPLAGPRPSRAAPATEPAPQQP